MNENKQLYKEAFSKLHASNELNWEEMKMKKKTTGVRCKRSLAVLMAIVIMMVAMTCIGYAATGGKIFDEAKVWIGEKVFKVKVVEDSSNTKDSEVNITIDELVE